MGLRPVRIPAHRDTGRRPMLPIRCDYCEALHWHGQCVSPSSLFGAPRKRAGLWPRATQARGRSRPWKTHAGNHPPRRGGGSSRHFRHPFGVRCASWEFTTGVARCRGLHPWLQPGTPSGCNAAQCPALGADVRHGDSGRRVCNSPHCPAHGAQWTPESPCAIRQRGSEPTARAVASLSASWRALLGQAPPIRAR